MSEKDKYVIGLSVNSKAAHLLYALHLWSNEQFLWIDEVLAEAKKTMASYVLFCLTFVTCNIYVGQSLLVKSIPQQLSQACSL